MSNATNGPIINTTSEMSIIDIQNQAYLLLSSTFNNRTLHYSTSFTINVETNAHVFRRNISIIQSIDRNECTNYYSDFPGLIYIVILNL
jgi:hypothetical protein